MHSIASLSFKIGEDSPHLTYSETGKSTENVRRISRALVRFASIGGICGGSIDTTKGYGS